MAMQNGSDRPDREGQEADGADSWYFDLPRGAWERQEAKNRALRERVHNNLEDRRNVEDDLPPEPPLVLEQLADEHPGPLEFSFEDDDDDDDEEWSTEPPFILDEGGPQSGKPAGPAGSAGDAKPPLLIRRTEGADTRSEAWSTGGGGEGTEEGGLSAMRAWASQRRESERGHILRPAAELEDGDSPPATERTETPASEPEPGENPDRPFSVSEWREARREVTGSEASADGEAKPSRWDDMFSRPAESDGLAAMRAWASTPASEAEPRPRLMLEDDPAEPAPVRPELLEPFAWEKDEAPRAPVRPELLEPFEWEKDEAEAVPVPPQMLEPFEGERDKAAESAAVRPELLEPFAWEKDGANSGDSSDPGTAPEAVMLVPQMAEEATPPALKKRGLFGRLFGRKQHEEDIPDDVPDYGGDWVEVEPGSSDLRTVATAAGAVEQEPEFSWGPNEASGSSLEGAGAIGFDDAPVPPRFEDSIAERVEIARPPAAGDEVVSQTAAFLPAREAIPGESGEPAAEAAIDADTGPQASKAAEETADFADAPAEADETADGWSPEPYGEDEDAQRVALAELDRYSDDDLMGWEPENSAREEPEAPGSAQPVAETNALHGWGQGGTRADAELDGESTQDERAPEVLEFKSVSPFAESTAAEPSIEPILDEDPWSAVTAAEVATESAEALEPQAEQTSAESIDPGELPLAAIDSALDGDAWSDITAVEEATIADSAPSHEPAPGRQPTSVDEAQAEAIGEAGESFEAFATGAGEPVQHEPDVEPGLEHGADPPPVTTPIRLVNDDPWADFFSTQGEVQGGDALPPTEDAPPDDPVELDPGGQEPDDPWAAIAAASGYSAASASGVAVYRGPDPEEETPDWDEPGEFAEPAVELRPFTDTAEAPEATASADNGGWQEEDDVLLRAFERHAAAPDPAETPAEEKAAFAQLLGEDADDLVESSPGLFQEPLAFGRLSAWAPQRPGRTSIPSQVQWDGTPLNSEPSYEGDESPGWSTEESEPVPPPPWARDEAEERAEAAPVSTNGRRARTLIRELVETGLLALLVFLSVRASFQNFKVDGTSMYPTLQNGEFLIVNKLEYAEIDMKKLSSFVPFMNPGADDKRAVFHEPQRGDIIVLKDPRNPDTDLIKRIIGLPGETVEIANGHVYINDHLLEEPYIKSPWHDNRPKISLPADEYFVMGDNRDNSLDSRNLGPVHKELIIGKATLSYWPLSRFGLAPNESGDVSLKDGPPRLTAQTLPAAAASH